jgi:transcriptional regulator with XRE-family HTH domain
MDVAVSKQTKTLVELALKHLKCSQKELALKVGVSPTQVSKWKSDPAEHMSMEMREKFAALLQLDDENEAQVIAWAGSRDDANKWTQLFTHLAEDAMADAETGYNVVLFEYWLESGLLAVQTIDVLNDIGVTAPGVFPDEMLTLSDDDDDNGNDDNDPFHEAAEAHPIASLVQSLYAALVNVDGFYRAFVDDFINDMIGEPAYMDSGAMDFEPCLLHLAACKIDADEKVAPQISAHRQKWIGEYEEWIAEVKGYAMRNRIPLRAELLDLAYDESEFLRDAAEKESMGFNKRNLHPDVYMNELLVGMRTLHQVLPAIMAKLGMTQADFALDRSALFVGGGQRWPEIMDQLMVDDGVRLDELPEAPEPVKSTTDDENRS